MKEQLSISDKQKFGTEIEYVDVYKYVVDKEISRQIATNNLSVRIIKGSDSYKEWSRTPDPSVISFKGDHYSGEVVSPILQNKVQDLKELKTICHVLKRLGANVNGTCGAHIHFDAAFLEDNTIYIQNLILLYMCYEDILYRFAAGEQLTMRPGFHKYAATLNSSIDLKTLERYLYEEQPFDEFCDNFIKNRPLKCDGLCDGLYLRRLDHSLGNNINTIEFRIPNGTLNYDVWFNNINTFGLMMEFAKKMGFGHRDDLYCKIVKQKNEPFNYEKEDLIRAKEFIQLISKNKSDETRFIKQYQKVIE